MSGLIKDVTCAVLVGGESRRMGRDKSLIEVAGKTLIERSIDTAAGVFEDVVVSVREAGYEVPGRGKGIRLIEDVTDKRGPGVGLLSVLEATKGPWVMLLSCDVPLLSGNLLRYLAQLRDDFDCIVPVVEEKLQTTCALYGRGCLKPLRERIAEGKSLGLASFINDTEELKVRYVEQSEIERQDPGLSSFTDVDTPEELEALEQRLTKGE